MTNAGKLIVIDGPDGAGKKTQSKLLIAHLESIGRHAKYFDFPRHGKPSAAMVDAYLTGKFGGVNDVNPYAASIFYAVDRYAASAEIRETLNSGFDVVCDRYVTANMGHQTAKIHDDVLKDEFLDWLNELEFGHIFHIPRPDVNIILFVSAKIAQEHVDKKTLRAYLGESRRDIHENSMQHLHDASLAYQYISKKYGYPLIDCAPNGHMLTENQVHELLWKIVETKLLQEKDEDLTCDLYVSHSLDFDYANELYKPLKESAMINGFRIILPHEHNNEAYDIKKLIDNSKNLTFLAEISRPSTGQGIELSWANRAGISIIAFYKEGSDYSKSASRLSEKCFSYKDYDEMIRLLENKLSDKMNKLKLTKVIEAKMYKKH